MISFINNSLPMNGQLDFCPKALGLLDYTCDAFTMCVNHTLSSEKYTKSDIFSIFCKCVFIPAQLILLMQPYSSTSNKFQRIGSLVLPIFSIAEKLSGNLGKKETSKTELLVELAFRLTGIGSCYLLQKSKTPTTAVNFVANLVYLIISIFKAHACYQKLNASMRGIETFRNNLNRVIEENEELKAEKEVLAADLQAVQALRRDLDAVREENKELKAGNEARAAKSQEELQKLRGNLDAVSKENRELKTASEARAARSQEELQKLKGDLDAVRKEKEELKAANEALAAKSQKEIQKLRGNLTGAMENNRKLQDNLQQNETLRENLARVIEDLRKNRARKQIT